MQIERRALAWRWGRLCGPRQSGWCFFSSVTLWVALSLSFTHSVWHPPAAREPLALLSIGCLFSQYQIIPGIYLLLFFFFFYPCPFFWMSIVFFLCHSLFSLMITFPVTFSSTHPPWDKLHPCHNNTQRLDHILHHLDSCSLAWPLPFSMVAIITYSVMLFLCIICSCAFSSTPVDCSYTDADVFVPAKCIISSVFVKLY